MFGGYGVRAQESPTALGAGDMVFGFRRAPQHAAGDMVFGLRRAPQHLELAIWCSGAGVPHRRRKRKELHLCMVPKIGKPLISSMS